MGHVNPSNPKSAFALVVDVGLLPRVKVQQIPVDARCRFIIRPPGTIALVAPIPCVANVTLIRLILSEELIGHPFRQLPPHTVAKRNLDHRVLFRRLAVQHRPIWVF